MVKQFKSHMNSLRTCYNIQYLRNHTTCDYILIHATVYVQYAVQKLGERVKCQLLYAEIIIEGCPIELLQCMEQSGFNFLNEQGTTILYSEHKTVDGDAF